MRRDRRIQRVPALIEPPIPSRDDGNSSRERSASMASRSEHPRATRVRQTRQIRSKDTPSTTFAEEYFG
jgi:hypothetical protein